MLTAQPPAPTESPSPSQAEQELAPIRQLMLRVAHQLDARQSSARITALEPRDIAGQFRTEEYSLLNKAGRHRMLRIGFMLKVPGKIPCLMLHGLDQPGREELAPLADDGRIPAQRMDQILDILERFLTRFLSGTGSLPGSSDNPAQAEDIA